MQFQKNKHVEQLYRHIPFHGNTAALYEEHSDSDAIRPVETQALRYVRELVRSDTVSLVVLTGDAGHGKTHLCRRLLEEYGHDPDTALRELYDDAEGTKAWPPRNGEGRAIRIVKDLSDFDPPSVGAALLSRLLEDEDAVGVVCANEGRLRDAVSSADDGRLDVLVQALEASGRLGATSVDGVAHVINLNYQAVTSTDTCFLLHVLEDWAANQVRWSRSCGRCDAAPRCSIKLNQEFLGGSGKKDPLAQKRREAFVELVRVVEQSGYVLTIRECLTLAAYALTGGLRCEDVHTNVRRNAHAELARHRVLPLLFERRLSAREAKQLKVLRMIRRLDPGLRPLRSIDDELQNAIDEDEVEASQRAAPPRNRKEQRQLRERTRQIYQRGRRQRFFEAENGPSHAARLGLRHYDDFVMAVDGTAEERGARWRETRDQLVAGLHVVQGLRPRSSSHLLIADPAFGNARGSAAVIAVRTPVAAIDIVAGAGHWRTLGGGEDPDLVRAVDWLERRLVARLGKSPRDILELDLLQFEFLMRAGEGVSFRSFHAPDIRRILACLAKIAAGARGEYETILVLDGGSLRSIMLDVGDVIRVGEG